MEHRPIHRLTQVDYERRTAVCSICGPVRIAVSPHGKYNYINRRCVNAKVSSATSAKNRRNAANKELINKYKLRKGCKRCGYRSPNPKEFRLFELHLPRKEQIAILAWDGGRDRLLQELEKRDVYCWKCYRLIHREITHNIPAPPVKPFRDV